MQDNVANETIVSLESAHWGHPYGPNPEVGMKHALKNWTTGTGMLGTVIMNVKRNAWPCLRLSPDRKWITFSKHDFIYLLDANDKLKDVKGNEIPFRVGDDFLRVSWRNGDPKQGIDYQYLFRKVAFKDAEGKLQKTPTYQQLLERAKRPTVQGACCNFYLCNISDEEYGSIYDSLDDHQILIPGPEVDLPWSPDARDPQSEIPVVDSIIPPLSSIFPL